MGKNSLAGETASKFTTIKQQMKNLIPEYKALYLYYIYAPELLPDSKIQTFDDLKEHFKMFPQGIIESQAKLWLYEEPTQNALKVLLKAKHAQRMTELYNIYFEKAKEDVQAFKAFVDFSATYFKDNQESELQKILNGVNLDEE